jgi:hypothetical protein
MGTLDDCYGELSSVLDVVEPHEAVVRAEEHRSFWRPERVRVALLAESHVFTTLGDLERRVVRAPSAPARAPTGFVRLVYCLGYGENDILDRRIVEPPNTGTPQYWKIFYACLNGAYRPGDFAPILASQTPSHVRVANKVDALLRLRDAGVWLLDASPCALYAPGGLKPTPATVSRAIEIGYEMHVRLAIEAAEPAAVICIGRGVGRVLEYRLKRTGARVTVLPQPNARLTSDEHREALIDYGRIVRGAT